VDTAEAQAAVGEMVPAVVGTVEVPAAVERAGVAAGTGQEVGPGAPIPRGTDIG
jgi:hypothetical protein